MRVLWIIVLCFVFGINLCYAETIWEKRQKVLSGETAKETKETPVTPATDATDYDTSYNTEDDLIPPVSANEPVTPAANASPFNITVPAQYGSVIESNQGTNGKLIIHIQDAHANYEAQKNIAAIIENLIKNNDAKVVLKEAAATDKNFMYLREKASVEAREKAAEKLLKDATITGTDYFALTSSYPMSFHGIEDKALYDENRQAIWDMDKFKDSALEYANKSAGCADSIKAKIYNADLLAMDKAKKDYENETIDLLAYYKELNKLVQKKNINTGEFANFTNLVKIDTLEQKINMAKIRDNTATDEEKALYKEYQGALKNLNVNKLFKEEPLIENKIKDAISDNEDQKQLYGIAKAISIMDKMLSVKLVPEEYNYFMENKTKFDPETWANFFRKKSDELGLNLDVPDNYYSVKDNLATIEKVYKTAMQRDNVFVSKTEEAIGKDNANSAILVVGGFHTPNLTNILSEKGYSYVVISPRVTTKTDDNLYRQALKSDQ